MQKVFKNSNFRHNVFVKNLQYCLHSPVQINYPKNQLGYLTLQFSYGRSYPVKMLKFKVLLAIILKEKLLFIPSDSQPQINEQQAKNQGQNSNNYKYGHDRFKRIEKQYPSKNN